MAWRTAAAARVAAATAARTARRPSCAPCLYSTWLVPATHESRTRGHDKYRPRRPTVSRSTRKGYRAAAAGGGRGSNEQMLLCSSGSGRHDIGGERQRRPWRRRRWLHRLWPRRSWHARGTVAGHHVVSHDAGRGSVRAPKVQAMELASCIRLLAMGGARARCSRDLGWWRKPGRGRAI